MSAGADVVRQVRLGTREDLARMGQLSEIAIASAIQASIPRIMHYALTTGSVPRDTGRLQDTVGVTWTGRNIVLVWTAQDPRTGWHYADHVDKTHVTHSGFSLDVAFATKLIFREELIKALAAM